ncbi:MAG: neutral/alkaline non-lysosomal ceramidase N-terminal domain-containing protein [Deltaproteobacteria bacterium]|nr:neutral/alkaline non-lysosomal ceramidase N-terminal domain-containing protein [Deltaproteobacteria bacterium]
MARALPLASLVFGSLVVVACEQTPTTSDAAIEADADTDALLRDVGNDADELPPRTREELPAAGPLVAGIAEAGMPVPLGIGTMGFGAIGVDPNPSPFAEMYPGTTRAHGTLDVRAVVLSRGDAYEVVLVRLDTVGVFQQLREAVLDELETRLGRRLDDALVLAGNHTHSGPGRLLLASGALELLADSFFPEFYDRVIDTIADVVEAAFADARSAEIGHVVARSRDAHSDRRCENDPLPQLQESPDMPIVAIRREGRLDAIVASYGYHGTILGIEEHTLSGDMGAVVEQRVAERFDHPVSVLFFNSWGADMAPGDPTIDPGATGAAQPDGYDRMDALGRVVADVIEPAVASMTYASDVAIRARTFRVRLDRDAIGYAPDVFRYPHGGVYCSGDGDCEHVARIEGLDRRCLAISARDNLPKQTLFTAGEIGALRFVTAPGEWTTALGARVLDRVRERSGGDAMLIGYANDYTGYSTGEDDWWQGGYEASGALWGPGQGDYLAARAIESYESFHELWNQPPWREPAPVPPFSGYTYTPYVTERALAVGEITIDAPANVLRTDVVQVEVNGSDPWLGLPTATLQRDDGTGTFEPVLRGNGRPLDSRGVDFWIDLATTPTYAETERADARTFAYRIHFPVSRRGSEGAPLPAGDYRLRISVPTELGTTEVTSGTFTIP